MIGSGATAVTMVPEMAKTAAHVTMLQRSPTYVVSRPAEDEIANCAARQDAGQAGLRHHPLEERRPADCCSSAARARSRRRPRSALPGLVQRAPGTRLRHRDPLHAALQSLGPAAVPGARQPTCSSAIKAGTTSVVTDQIDTFTETGINAEVGPGAWRPTSSSPPRACDLQLLGEMRDVSSTAGRSTSHETTSYKGMMYGGVPNLASTFGYTNASWTLKGDLTCEYTCRIIKRMTKTGARAVTPRNLEPGTQQTPWLDFRPAMSSAPSTASRNRAAASPGA